ncbi:MAG: hypothetical protein H6R26_3114 [Proteobacteria bacterium]|nr:hypothetical protein [Pseudomonadota bacterium]
MKQNAVTPAMSIALAAACAATTVSCSGTGVFRQVMDLPEQTNVSRSDHAVAASAEQSPSRSPIGLPAWRHPRELRTFS